MEGNDKKDASDKTLTIADKVKMVALITLIVVWFFSSKGGERVTSEPFQWWILFICWSAFFIYGAWSNKTAKGVVDYAKAVALAASLVFAFAFVTEGKGCSSSGSDYSDCRPAGPGIYNDC